MTKRSGICAIALACGALATVLPTSGQADEDHVTARKLRDAGEIQSLEDISAKARALRAGEILETELERSKGRYVYEVEILDTEGKVWELKLDAKTGDLIKMELDD